MPVQIIAVVRPLQFSAKRSRITALHVPRDRELKQVKLFIGAPETRELKSLSKGSFTFRA